MERRHVAGHVERDDRVLGPVQDQRRDAHGREHVTDVDLLVHAMQGLERTWARPVPDDVHERLHLVLAEAAERAKRVARALAGAEEAQIPLDLAFVLLLGSAPGVIRSPHPARERAADDERRCALRVGRREQDGHRGALRHADEGRTAGPDGVHDSPDVVHARLQRGRAADAVRHPRPALVEANQPGERRELLERGGQDR
jgi:hypothetical protein